MAMKGNRRQRDGLTEYTYVPFLSFGDASGLGVKRRIHEAVGGFDEDLLACEDCDYGWRIQMTGTPLRFVPDALLHSRHKDAKEGAFLQAKTWGQAHAMLIKKFRPLGMPKAPLSTGLRLWWQLLLHPPVLGTQGRRDEWLWNLSYRYGQLLGCIKYRILAL
jgi:GT2 family glycosyltransferase